MTADRPPLSPFVDPVRGLKSSVLGAGAGILAGAAGAGTMLVTGAVSNRLVPGFSLGSARQLLLAGVAGGAVAGVLLGARVSGDASTDRVDQALNFAIVAGSCAAAVAIAMPGARLLESLIRHDGQAWNHVRIASAALLTAAAGGAVAGALAGATGMPRHFALERR